MSTSSPANDKRASIEFGDSKEYEFIDRISPKLPIEVRMNPEKKSDPTVIDYVCQTTNTLADLKTRRTPFFTAGRSYELDPQYAVTFNTDAFARYSRADGDVLLLFWVMWEETKGYGVEVEKLHGVWAVTVSTVREWVNGGRAPQHTYKSRTRSDEHSTASYVLSLDWMVPIRVYNNSYTVVNDDWVDELDFSSN